VVSPSATKQPASSRAIRIVARQRFDFITIIPIFSSYILG